MNELRLISTYKPPILTEPVLILSTSAYYYDGKQIENETALAFVDALDNNEALNKHDFEAWDNWIIIKKHKTKNEACNFHIDLAKKLSWDYENHYEIYHKLLRFTEK